MLVGIGVVGFSAEDLAYRSALGVVSRMNADNALECTDVVRGLFREWDFEEVNPCSQANEPH